MVRSSIFKTKLQSGGAGLYGPVFLNGLQKSLQSGPDRTVASLIEDGDWIDIIEDDTPRPLLTCQIQSRLSTTASMRIELYEEVTGKKAGQVFDDTENIDHDNGRQTPKRPLCNPLCCSLPLLLLTPISPARPNYPCRGTGTGNRGCATGTM